MFKNGAVNVLERRRPQISCMLVLGLPNLHLSTGVNVFTFSNCLHKAVF